MFTRQPNKGVIDTVRDRLENRLKVLDENRMDRSHQGGEDMRYEKSSDHAAKTWNPHDPQQNRLLEEEAVYLVIDSAARNKASFPHSGSFKVTLAEEVNNVIKVELIQASIPLTEKNVHLQNNILRFSVAPHTSVETVTVPVGAYLGDALALEIQTQMNLSLFAADIATNTVYMNFRTGFVGSKAGVRGALLNQFKVTFNDSQRGLTFQIVDIDDVAVAASVFALHVQKEKTNMLSVLYSERADDIFDVCGFERNEFVRLGTYHAGSDTYYIASNNGTTVFGTAANADARYAYALRSNQAVDLRGNLAVMVDISPFNDNDVAHIGDSGSGTQAMREYFAVVLMRPASSVEDASFDLCNNTYPMSRYFRDGKERVKDLTVALRRPDGTIMDLGNLNFMLTLRLTVKRVQPVKPVFTR